jgi:hypothetical protein
VKKKSSVGFVSLLNFRFHEGVDVSFSFTIFSSTGYSGA